VCVKDAKRERETYRLAGNFLWRTSWPLQTKLGDDNEDDDTELYNRRSGAHSPSLQLLQKATVSVPNPLESRFPRPRADAELAIEVRLTLTHGC